MKIRLFVSLFIACVLGISFVSCNDDDDDKDIARAKWTTPMDSLFHSLDSVVLHTADTTILHVMGSIAITESGTLVYSKAMGYADVEQKVKNTVNTKFRIGSLTKTFTSVLILKAIDEGKLTLDKTIETYFPTVPNASKITISHLLYHQSGVFNFTSDRTLPENWVFLPKTKEELIAQIAGYKPDFEPGQALNYSNSGYVLLSFILEDIYKKEYKEILKEKITDPLRLGNTYYGGKVDISNNESYSYEFRQSWMKTPETDMSIPSGAGAIVSTPSDICKFITALFDYKIINKNSVDKMTTFLEVKEMGPDGGVGMGVFKGEISVKSTTNKAVCWWHTGGIDSFHSVYYYFPHKKACITIMVNGSDVVEDEGDNFDVIDEISAKIYSIYPL